MYCTDTCIQGITRYYKVLQGITRYYNVLQGITRYYKVLQFHIPFVENTFCTVVMTKYAPLPGLRKGAASWLAQLR